MTPNATTKFTGKAYATLSGQSDDKVVSGNAVMDVNTSNYTENLAIKFDNWYDMTFTTDENGIADLAVTEGANYQDNGFNFKDGTVENPTLEARYYGSNNRLEESAGTFSASVRLNNSQVNTIEGAFGTKKN